MDTPRHIVVMGVSGTGKTTIGQAVAEQLGAVFVEGDQFHPQANVDKMASGVPLDDDDRRPWLEALAGRIREFDEQAGLRSRAARPCGGPIATGCARAGPTCSSCT